MIPDFQSKEYKRSRVAYNAQCALEYFVQLLTADAFFAKLLRDIGFSESATGVISSFAALAFLFEFFTLFLAAKRVNPKKTVILMDTVSIVCFGLLFLVPFLQVQQTLRFVITVFLTFVGYFFKYGEISLYFKWANSFVAPENRARFSAMKEMISLIAGILFSLAIGFIMDAFEEAGNLHGAFLFIAISVFVLAVASFVSLYLIAPSQESGTEEKKSVPFSEVAKNTLGNKSFVYVTVATSVWRMAQYIVIGFYGTYKTENLLLTAGAVQVINMVANLGRFGASRPFGAYSDKHTYAQGFRLGMWLAAAGFLAAAFATKNLWWLIIVSTILINTAYAGTEQNCNNMMYSYVKSDYIVQAMAIKNGISGLLSFLMSVLGARILSAVQASGNTLFGIPMAGQQFLSVVAFVMIVGNIFFTKLVVEKQKVMLQ